MVCIDNGLICYYYVDRERVNNNRLYLFYDVYKFLFLMICFV